MHLCGKMFILSCYSPYQAHHEFTNEISWRNILRMPRLGMNFLGYCTLEWRCRRGILCHSYYLHQGLTRFERVRDEVLGGGNSNIFYFHPEHLGKRSNLTCAYFSNGSVQPPTSLESSFEQLDLLNFIRMSRRSTGQILCNFFLEQLGNTEDFSAGRI